MTLLRLVVGSAAVLIFSVTAIVIIVPKSAPLPPEAYGRAPKHTMACQHWEGLERVNKLFAWGDHEGAKRVLTVLWRSESCISLNEGEPFFSDGQPNQQGFVKVGQAPSAIGYFTESTILRGRRSDRPAS